jgi:hypothetical protein
VEAYEYIFAALALVAVFTAAAYLAVTALPPYRSVSEIDQLKVAAQKVMNSILLSPGYPHDWGSDVGVKASDLTSFGLAPYTVFTRDAYVLDQDKVQRLCREVPDPLYLPPSVVLELLGLGLDYGMKMEFAPALGVRLESSQGSGLTVDVASEQGVPIEGANVTVVALYLSNGRLSTSTASGKTDLGGRCALSVTYSPPALFITMVDSYGIIMINVSTVGPGVHRALVMGKHIVTNRSDLGGIGAYQLFVSSGLGGTFEVKNASCTLMSPIALEGYNVYAYDMGFEEPGLVAVVAVKGSELVVAYKLVPKSYPPTSGDVYPPLSYVLERSVKIGPSNYNFKLRIWRTSW